MKAASTDSPGWRLNLRELARGRVPIVIGGEVYSMSFAPRGSERLVGYFHMAGTTREVQATVDGLRACLNRGALEGQ